MSAKPNYSKRWELAGYLASAHVDAIMTGLSLDNHMSIDEVAYNRGKERYHIEHPRDWVLSKPKPTIEGGIRRSGAVTRPITPHDPKKCAYCASHPETRA
jgi:hypothetical protein